MKKASFSRPAIKSGMGSWIYYISTMTFSQIASYINRTDEIYTSQKLNDMVQKGIADNMKAICDYIETEKRALF